MDDYWASHPPSDIGDMNDYWDSRPSYGDGGGGAYGNSGGSRSSGDYYDPSAGWQDCASYDPCYGSRTDRIWAETFEDPGPALDPWGGLTGAPGPSYDDPWGGTQLDGNCAYQPSYAC
jgi:hypothetical protein